jgi:hypothetical protein
MLLTAARHACRTPQHGQPALCATGTFFVAAFGSSIAFAAEPGEKNIAELKTFVAPDRPQVGHAAGSSDCAKPRFSSKSAPHPGHRN